MMLINLPSFLLPTPQYRKDDAAGLQMIWVEF